MESEGTSTPWRMTEGQSRIDANVRHEMVREAAYELYLRRGCVNGFAVSDWLKAETVVDHMLSKGTATNLRRRSASHSSGVILSMGPPIHSEVDWP